MIKCTHLIHIKKRTAKESQKYFIVAIDNLDKRTKFNITDGYVVAQGFWADQPVVNDVETATLLEVWIPNNNIDHIESLIYRQRN